MNLTFTPLAIVSLAGALSIGASVAQDVYFDAATTESTRHDMTTAIDAAIRAEFGAIVETVASHAASVSNFNSLCHNVRNNFERIAKDVAKTTLANRFPSEWQRACNRWE